MNATQPLTGLHRVPEWPRLAATVANDGTGTLTINGVTRACAAESVAALRTGIIARAVAIGTQLRRPIRLDVTEEGRTHALAVRPEGYVQLIGADGTIPAPDGLSIDEGRCRVCRRLQPVTSATCVQCGVDEPLRVEVAPPAEPNTVTPPAAQPVTRPRLVELVDEASMPLDGFSGATPSEICQRYAAGFIDRAKLVDELTRFPYVKGGQTDGYDSLVVDPPGTWSEVSDAARRGLIEDDVYEEVFNRRHGIDPAPALDELHDVEHTRISRRVAAPAAPPAPVLHLAFSTQRSVDVGPHVVIGRNPEPVDGREALTVVTPGRMLSRTHATIDVDVAGRIVVTDLDSANGIELQSAPPQWLIPGEPTVIPDGATILLGDVYCTVARAQ